MRNHCGYHFRELELADTPALHVKDDDSLWLDQSAFACPGMTDKERDYLFGQREYEVEPSLDDLEGEYDKCNDSWYYILEIQ